MVINFRKNMLLEYLLYRIYTRMIKINEEMPLLRSFIYLSIVIITILFSVVVLTQGFIKYLIKHEFIGINIFSNTGLNFLFVLLFSMIYTYLRFFYKKDFSQYEEKYRNHKINKYFIDLFLFLIPFLLFIIGPAIAVLLFGGTIFGFESNGLF